MERVTKKVSLQNPQEFKQQLLSWAQQFEQVLWLDSNNYNMQHSQYDAVLAVDAYSELSTPSEGAFDALKTYQATENDYIFGYLSYDLKNDTEDLKSENFDGLEFPELYFFRPKRLFLFSNKGVTLKYLTTDNQSIDADLTAIKSVNHQNKSSDKSKGSPIKIKLRIHKDGYHSKLKKVLNHIHRGDIYEANFCQEFYAENTRINPLEIYNNLNTISGSPFASYFKSKHHYILSASPERYIQKVGNTVISQPIKGTAKRSLIPEEDAILKSKLAKDPKEIAENIMIVDLVRNDLSKIAQKGSVKVQELCKAYSFKQVHQLISTITCTMDVNTSSVDILRHTFPMGSMTGAPKISAMQIMEILEETKRGVYSGAIGYISPTGDFDFNVVIRSILYNAQKKYISFSVGGAITAKSIPEKEYEECLLKANAMKKVLVK
ncbi:MAG: aminodeoxychorismate synthase component I [Flavobacteriaceae bacterium]|nr:MAG: aminodeoxychorismate synthase component I [Flavobacteriaceae bacterium]